MYILSSGSPHRYNMCTYDIDLQLVADEKSGKCLRKLGEGGGKSGNFFQIFGLDPLLILKRRCLYVICPFISGSLTC